MVENLSPFISEKIDTEVFNVIKIIILIQTDQFLLLQIVVNFSIQHKSNVVDSSLLFTLLVRYHHMRVLPKKCQMIQNNNNNASKRQQATVLY